MSQVPEQSNDRNQPAIPAQRQPRPADDWTATRAARVPRQPGPDAR